MKSVKKIAHTTTSSPRLILFASTALFFALVTLDIGIAWIFSSNLTHPPCYERPSPLKDFTPEKHLLHTEDGLDINAWYYPSRNGAAIVAMGGLSGSLGQSLPPVAQLITEGYGVLQLDSRACASPPAPVTLGALEVLDAKAAIHFLQSREEVDAHRIGAFGFSMGSVTLIRTASKDNSIAALIAEGGYHNLGDDFVEPDTRKTIIHAIFLYTVTGAFWLQTGNNPWAISPIDDLPNISPRPVLLIYGEDEVESGHALAQYDATQDPKELWIIPQGSHGINHLVAGNLYERKISDFFDHTLLGLPIMNQP